MPNVAFGSCDAGVGQRRWEGFEVAGEGLKAVQNA